jgi:hypothetical protein
METSKKEIEFYSKPGIRTKVKQETFKDFPDNIEKIVKIVQGLVIHRDHVKNYGIKISKKRFEEVDIKTVSEMIDYILKLDKNPLTVLRKPNKRIIGICKHFAMFLCSILRYKGIPARTRCGFATYFQKGFFDDHWICEYWNKNEKRWIYVDCQVDEKQKKEFGLEKSFVNLFDLKKGEFIDSGSLWIMYRKKEINPKTCGFSTFNEKGEWYIRGNLLRDFFSLNKIQYLYYEEDFLMKESYPPCVRDIKLLDEIGKLTSNADKNFAKIRRLYGNRKDLIPKLLVNLTK